MSLTHRHVMKKNSRGSPGLPLDESAPQTALNCSELHSVPLQNHQTAGSRPCSRHCTEESISSGRFRGSAQPRYTTDDNIQDNTQQCFVAVKCVLWQLSIGLINLKPRGRIPPGHLQASCVLRPTQPPTDYGTGNGL